MHARTNPFVSMDRRGRWAERAWFAMFRLATYFILACATIIFGMIFYKGSQTVFQSTAPFINIPFLTESPETLFVFEYEGQKLELGDREFRAFK